jgi:hypothetical protein
LVLDECPFCHKFLAAEEISKEQVDSDTEDMLADPPRIGVGRFAPSPSPSPVIFFTTYKILYRCKHCGKEWRKMSNEEKGIPRREAGTEQATDEDVEREEEMAKEEQYAGE